MTNPEARGALVQLVFGAMAAQAVGAAVRLGVPDELADRERTAPEVAEACATDPDATRRLLRALAALDLLTETGADTFALTLPVPFCVATNPARCTRSPRCSPTRP